MRRYRTVKPLPKDQTDRIPRDQHTDPCLGSWKVRVKRRHFTLPTHVQRTPGPRNTDSNRGAEGQVGGYLHEYFVKCRCSFSVCSRGSGVCVSSVWTWGGSSGPKERGSCAFKKSRRVEKSRRGVLPCRVGTEESPVEEPSRPSPTSSRVKKETPGFPTVGRSRRDPGLSVSLSKYWTYRN